jgi:hypothetical protein
MINLHRALNNDHLLRALTGLNQQAFDELLPVFAAAWQTVYPYFRNWHQAGT